MTVQQTYTINPPVGFAGTIAEPNAPTRTERGILRVPAAATRANPRPGDSLFWNTAQNAWEVPDTAAEQILVEGILTYRTDTVQSASSILQFSNGDEIEIVTMGVVWVQAGGNVERGNQLQMQTDDWKYDSHARVTGIANVRILPIVCYSASGADTHIVKAGIGFGRVI